MRIDGGKTLNPGTLRHRVCIRQKTITGTDGYGHDTYTWTDYQVCYAAIVALQGREFEAARQIWADARFRVTVPYLTGVTTQMRVHWDETAQDLEILDVQDPWGTRTVLQMTCKQIQ